MNTTIKTKGGEEKLTFPTGAQRGTEEGKPKFDQVKPMYLFTMTDMLRENQQTDVYSYNEQSFGVECGKPIYGKVPYQEQDSSMIPDIMINRLGGLFWRGAQKYNRDNWKKGMSMARTFGSLFRHMVYWWAGDTSEDHLAAVIWNATVLMWTENEVAEGRLPADLADCGPMGSRF